LFVLEGILHVDIEVFMLIFVRMTGLFVIAPIFEYSDILQNRVFIHDGIDTCKYLKEFLVGITLGYVAYMIFTAIYVAGQFIDMQIGFGVVNVIDPLNSTQVSITSNFYFWFS